MDHGSLAHVLRSTEYAVVSSSRLGASFSRYTAQIIHFEAPNEDYAVIEMVFMGLIFPAFNGQR